MGKWKIDIALVLKDKNDKIMIRNLSLFPDFDDLVILPANQEDTCKTLVGESIVSFCQNGIALPEGKLTFMGVSDIWIGKEIPETDTIISTFLDGGYEDANFPNSELPDDFVVQYPMWRRAKYRIQSLVDNAVGYYKTPEDVNNADPVEFQETYAFPILSVFNTLNGGSIGTSKLYTDQKYIYWFAAPLQTDHIQARGSRV